MSRSIAFKCTYNDGGTEGQYIGFNGTCSRDNIVTNIEARRVWCSNVECGCFEFYNNGLKGEIPENPCFESELFSDWKFGAGTYHNGVREGEPMHIRDTDIGEIAIITTRFPKEAEENRRIIGLFEIGELVGNDEENDGETIVYANEQSKIRLTREVASELYFWAYHKNSKESNICRWGTGLFRYLDENCVHRILYDISSITKDLTQRDEINQLILRRFGETTPDPASGVIAQKSKTLVKRLALARKYGGGGEGEDHLRLKNLIASNPELIGLPKKAVAKVEHMFLSGDCVDIFFTTPNGRKVVVEIETTTPMPGAHQVIKYRSLAAAQNNLSLDSDKIEGVLVAWSINNRVKAFCDFYDIEYYEIEPT